MATTFNWANITGGSNKQNKWAESIRANYVEAIDDMIAHTKDKESWTPILAALNAKGARFWIDNRTLLTRQLLKKIYEEMQTAESKAPEATEQEP